MIGWLWSFLLLVMAQSGGTVVLWLQACVRVVAALLSLAWKWSIKMVVTVFLVFDEVVWFLLLCLVLSQNSSCDLVEQSLSRNRLEVQ